MTGIVIREAGPADAATLDRALRSLSADLGDDHLAAAEALAAALNGPRAFAGAVLAEAGGTCVGGALFSPAFSTTLGGPGVVVSDLWVASGQRSAGVGRQLLAAAARSGAERWGAVYLRITAYADNARARAFYERLGFRFRDGDRNAILGGEALRRLGEGGA